MSQYPPQTNWNSVPPQKPSNAGRVAILIFGIVVGFGFLMVACFIGVIFAIGYRVNQAIEAEQEAAIDLRYEAMKQYDEATLARIKAKTDAAFREQFGDMPNPVEPPVAQRTLLDVIEDSKRELDRVAAQAKTGKAPFPGRTVDDVLPKNVSLKYEFPDQGWGLTSLAYTPNQKWLAAWKFDSGLVVFNLESGEQTDYIRNLSQFGRQTKMMFTPDGQNLVAAHDNGLVSIWALSEDGRLEQSSIYSPHTKKIHALDISSDGGLIVTCSEDEIVRMYDCKKGEMIWGNSEMREKVLDVQFIDGTDQIVVATPKAIVKMSCVDGTTTDSVEVGNVGYAIDSEFSPDSKTWLVSSGHEVHAVDVESGQTRETLKHRDMIWSVQMTSDNQWLICGGQRGVDVWDWTKKQLKFTIKVDDVIHVKSFALSADRKQIAAVRDGAQSILKVFDILEW